MRILAIRGKNLASLERFELCLEEGELGRAGIFAISGPTGSGKSTLLDALCVALFDRTPRLGGSSNVLVGRANQDDALRVGTNDVRGLLRRGTGEGHAEVDFEGIDGHRYRARWEVRRARGKATGRLQNAKMSLVELESEQSLGGKKTETLQAIEDRLGLSFEQFRRSALLAQGDFAAFLKANKDQRSDLLERMTGTEIYTQLSIAAYEQSKRAGERLATLGEQAEAAVVLDDEERAAQTSKLEELQRRRKSDAATLDASRGSLRWFEEERRLAADSERCASELEEAQKARSATEELERELSRVAWAHKERKRFDDLERAQKSVVELQEKLEGAVARSEKAVASEARAVESVEASRSALTAKRQAYREEQERRLHELDSEEAECRAWLEDHAELEGRGGRDEGLAELAAEALDARAESVAKELAGLRVRLAAEQKKLPERKEARATATAELQRCDEALSEVDLAAKRNEERACARRVEQLGRLVELHADKAEADAKLATATEELDGCTERYTLKKKEIEQKQEGLPLLDARLQEARTSYDKIRLALDLSDHRSALVDGEACPLCGSKEHPWAGGDEGANSLVAEQKARVDELQQGRQEIAEACAALKAEAEAIVDEGKRARQRHTERLQEAEKLDARIQELHSELELEKDAAELPALLESEKSTLEERRTELESLSQNEKARELARKAMDRARVSLEELEGSLGELDEQATTLAQRLSACDGYRYRLRKERSQLIEHQKRERKTQLDNAERHPFPELEKAIEAAESALQAAAKELATAAEQVEEGKANLEQAKAARAKASDAYAAALEELGISDEDYRALLSRDQVWMESASERIDAAKERVTACKARRDALDQRRKKHGAMKPEGSEEELTAKVEQQALALEALDEERVAIAAQLESDRVARERRAELGDKLLDAQKDADLKKRLSDLIGSADGKKFRVFAQSLTLDSLLAGANRHLQELSPRYYLERVPGYDLDLQVVDRHMADEVRSVQSLSGGESFLISLALALGLSSLTSRDVRVDSLLIDEGFGTLDEHTLELALGVLDSLQASGRKVGLISHVPGLAERIGVRVLLTPQGGGLSSVEIVGPGA